MNSNGVIPLLEDQKCLELLKVLSTQANSLLKGLYLVNQLPPAMVLADLSKLLESCRMIVPELERHIALLSADPAAPVRTLDT